MKTGKQVIWEKEGTQTIQVVPECECGGVFKLKGSASFHDEYTYTYQCPSCKEIEMFDGVFSNNSEEDFTKCGWKIKEANA